MKHMMNIKQQCRLLFEGHTGK